MHIDVPARRRHSIGLTPLIDVVFILLVFFMLATSLTDWRGIGLATGASPAEPDQPPPAVVRLAAGGQFHYQGEAIELQALARQLRRALDSGDISAAIVRPDEGVTLGPTIAAFDALVGAA